MEHIFVSNVRIKKHKKKRNKNLSAIYFLCNEIKKKGKKNTNITKKNIHKPCGETALDLAKSILFATKITALCLIKSMSCSDDNICSARLNDALSTTE